MRRHPRLSLVILRGVPALADVARLAVMHHERLDGSGYPYGMTAAELDLPARILQVADVAEALTAERPYRAALPIDDVLAIMRAEAGTRLDERLRRARGVAARSRPRPGGGRLMDIRLSEIVAALSHALDITEGQPMGHAERTCIIGMRLADAVGPRAARRSSLFYALLLKDAGCSTNAGAGWPSSSAPTTCDVKRASRLIDRSNAARSRCAPWPHDRARRAAAAARAPSARAAWPWASTAPASSWQIRCERGADIARADRPRRARRRRDPPARRALGRARLPGGLAGEEIPLLARIICLAQTSRSSAPPGGAGRRAARWRAARAGSWFDPALVDAVAAFERRRRLLGWRCDDARRLAAGARRPR